MASDVAVPTAPDRSLDQLALTATLNCLVGCATGEIVGMVIGTALGWGNLATVVLAISLAFLFGYALTSIPLRRSGMPMAAVVRTAVIADTVSITIMELIDNAFVLAVPGAMDAGLHEALFWGPLLGGFALAFGPAFLVTGQISAEARDVVRGPAPRRAREADDPQCHTETPDRRSVACGGCDLPPRSFLRNPLLDTLSHDP